MKIIRISTVILAVMLLVCAATGCVAINFSANLNGPGVRGTGPMETRTVAVDDFSALELYGNWNVTYKAEASNEITMEIQDNIYELLDISVKDGRLTIDSNERFSTDSGKTPKLTISTPELSGLHINGGLSLTQADTIQSDSFSLMVDGGCDVDLNLNVKKLVTNVSGAGDICFSGTADSARFSISGAGAIDALELQSKDASVSISGTGDVSVSCSDNLDVDISGAGAVSYRGSPSISKSLSGAASLSKVS